MVLVGRLRLNEYDLHIYMYAVMDGLTIRLKR
jgi:hypothetical protein